MVEETKKLEEKISEDIKELVIARLDVLPADKKISIGSYGEFTKSELIERVKKVIQPAMPIKNRRIYLEKI